MRAKQYKTDYRSKTTAKSARLFFDELINQRSNRSNDINATGKSPTVHSDAIWLEMRPHNWTSNTSNRVNYVITIAVYAIYLHFDNGIQSQRKKAQ